MKTVGGILLVVVMVLVAYGLGTMAHESEEAAPPRDTAEEVENFYCGVDEVEAEKSTKEEKVSPLSAREATARSVGYSWQTPMSLTVE